MMSSTSPGPATTTSSSLFASNGNSGAAAHSRDSQESADVFMTPRNNSNAPSLDELAETEVKAPVLKQEVPDKLKMDNIENEPIKFSMDEVEEQMGLTSIKPENDSDSETIKHESHGQDRAIDEARVSAYARLDFETHTFYVQTLQVVLGRRTENGNGMIDVHLSRKKAISRKHAKIFYNFGSQRFELSVLGRNGAFVSDQFVPMDTTVALHDGVMIQIGDESFRFVLPNQPATAEEDPPATDKQPEDLAKQEAEASIEQKRQQEKEEAEAEKKAAEEEEEEEDEENEAKATPTPTPATTTESTPAAASTTNTTSTPAPKKKETTRKQPRKVYTLEEIPPEYREKPPHSYSYLITAALRDRSPANGMSLADIYEAIRDLFPYYRYCDPAWQNSVRHNLSSNKSFRKVTKEGKGFLWGIDEEYFQEKERQKQRAAENARLKAERQAQQQQQRERAAAAAAAAAAEKQKVAAEAAAKKAEQEAAAAEAKKKETESSATAVANGVKEAGATPAAPTTTTTATATATTPASGAEPKEKTVAEMTKDIVTNSEAKLANSPQVARKGSATGATTSAGGAAGMSIQDQLAANLQNRSNGSNNRSSVTPTPTPQTPAQQKSATSTPAPAPAKLAASTKKSATAAKAGAQGQPSAGPSWKLSGAAAKRLQELQQMILKQVGSDQATKVVQALASVLSQAAKREGGNDLNGNMERMLLDNKRLAVLVKEVMTDINKNRTRASPAAAASSSPGPQASNAAQAVTTSSALAPKSEAPQSTAKPASTPSASSTAPTPPTPATAPVPAAQSAAKPVPPSQPSQPAQKPAAKPVPIQPATPTPPPGGGNAKTDAEKEKEIEALLAKARTSQNQPPKLKAMVAKLENQLAKIRSRRNQQPAAAQGEKRPGDGDGGNAPKMVKTE